MAVKVAGVTLRVTGADQFKADLDQANSALRKYKEQSKLLDASSSDRNSTDYLSQKQQLLTQQADAAKQRVESLKAAREAYAQSSDATAEGLEKFDMAILKAQTEEANFQAQLESTTNALRQAEKAPKGVTKSVTELGEALVNAGEKASKLGEKISTITAPITQAGQEAIKSAMELEDSLYNLATMPGVDVGDLETYRKELLAASNETGTAATELSTATYNAISSGVAAKDAVAFAALAAKTAKVGMTDSATVVDGATSMLNAWGEAAGGAEHVMDILIMAQNEGKTTVGAIASSIGQLTGIAPQVGVGINETAAAIAALTKNGVQTSTAINGLKAVMSNVIKPTTEASKVAQQLGLDFSASALQSKGFTGFLADVMEKTGGDTEVLAKLFGSVEGLNQVMLLGGSAAGDYADILAKMGDSAGTVDEAFETRISSSQQKVAIATNKISNAGTDLVASLTPAIGTVADLVSGAADAFNAMDAGTQSATLAVLGITASIGPVISTFGKLTTTLGTLLPMLASPAGLALIGGTAMAALAAYAVNAPSALEKAMAEVQSTLDGITISVDTDGTNAIKAYFEDGTAAAKEFIDIINGQGEETQNGLDLVDRIFGDGTMTRSEYSEMTKWVNQYVVPDISAAKKTVKKARQDFYKSLNGATNEDGSLMTTEQKNAAADAAVAPMQAIIDQMDAAKAELDALMKQIYQNGGTATEEELARMQELLGLLGEYQVQIDSMTNQAVNNAQGSYNNVKSGYYTESDLGTALGFVQGKYTSTGTALDDQVTALEAATSEALNAAKTEDEKAQVLESQAQQLAAIEASRREATGTMMAEYNDLFAGVAKANPEDAAALESMAGTLQQLNTLQHLMYQLESNDDGLDMATRTALLGNDTFMAALQNTLTGQGIDTITAQEMVANGGGLYMAEAVAAMMQSAADELATGAEGLDGSPLLTALSAMLSNTDLSQLDLSQMDGTLAAAMAVNLGQSNGWNMAGDSLTQALFGGLEGGLAEGWPESVQTSLDSGAGTAGASAGAKLATSYRDQMLQSLPTVLEGAQAIHDAVQEVIGSGYTISVPGFNFGGANWTGSAGSTGGNNNSVNVSINNANMMSRTSIKAFAAELSGLQRAQQAGKGLLE